MKRIIACFGILLSLLIPGIAQSQTPEGIQSLLVAKDKTRVYSSFTAAINNNNKIALLFHQAGSNRMEYDPIVSQLHIAGFDTLTIDQRSGGTRWNFDNMTVKRLGESAEYVDAYQDLEAALDYAVRRKYQTILLVGSSYSASLAIVLASARPDVVDGIAAFSPGEVFPDKNWVKTAVRDLKVPLYVTGADNERQRVEEVLLWAGDIDVTHYKPVNAVHGASTLREDQNPAGAKQNMASFISFVESIK
jgi:pimeloyl-ACP methyl ester carboxylesterase